MEYKSFRQTNLKYNKNNLKSKYNKGGNTIKNDINKTTDFDKTNIVVDIATKYIHPIKVYKINNIDEILDINSDTIYRIDELDKIKKKLNKTKSKLDTEFKNNKFGIYWREFDPFKNEKNIIAKLGNTYNVSNAWLKCYEMINYFNIIPDTSDGFIHFDNAAFPGSFIVSTHHLINTQRKWKKKYTWVASSLHDINKTRGALEDKYKLFQNYPDNWLMTKTNDGDVLLKENQLDFMKRLNHSVDLYTSDLGFSSAEDYNNQELIQSKANIGQILSGLLTLKKG